MIKSVGVIAEVLKDAKMLLMASLPANDPELAIAAAAGGADMIKVHINVVHAASGTYFGPLSEERGNIEKIISSVDIPVGIMPGAAEPAPFEDMLELARMGIGFYDIYASDMPAEYMRIDSMEPMVALGPGWSESDASALRSMGVNVIEASIIQHELYGNRLVMSDLLAYSSIADNFGGAVIVPTQKDIRPEEISLLHKAGVRGLMIGKIVTGSEPAGFEKATASFADEIKNL